MTVHCKVLADCSQNRQSAKINSPLKFPAIRYLVCGCGSHCVTALYIILLFHIFTATEELQIMVSPRVIRFDSSEQFNISCRAKNRQMLYNVKYQFFFNGIPIAAPSNSSYIMVPAKSSGNFTCNATQYSDLGTAIPSPMSAPIQAIVLSEPTRCAIHKARVDVLLKIY